MMHDAPQKARGTPVMTITLISTNSLLGQSKEPRQGLETGL